MYINIKKRSHIMSNPKFNEKELENTVAETGMFGAIPRYNYPVTPKEAYRAMLDHKPIWQTTGVESMLFTPMCYPDNIARAFIFEGRPFNPADGGGKDMFGIEWEYIPVAGGSMVRPGKPFLEDVDEWYDKVVWPNPDEWDWAGTAEANKEYLNTDKFITFWIMNGWFERLISFMEFEGAIMAMADEDYQEDVIKLFDKLSDLYIKVVDKVAEYFPQVDAICCHDDWGSQKETFFSPALVEKVIVPAMKKVTDRIHEKGMYAELHSCGQIYKQVPNIIKAGWDYWNPQPMNDTEKIYDEYGDKLVIGVIPKMSTAEEADEATQIAEADAFVKKYCSDPNKTVTINKTSGRGMTPAFARELYKASRIAYEDK